LKNGLLCTSHGPPLHFIPHFVLSQSESTFLFLFGRILTWNYCSFCLLISQISCYKNMWIYVFCFRMYYSLSLWLLYLLVSQQSVTFYVFCSRNQLILQTTALFWMDYSEYILSNHFIRTFKHTLFCLPLLTIFICKVLFRKSSFWVNYSYLSFLLLQIFQNCYDFSWWKIIIGILLPPNFQKDFTKLCRQTFTFVNLSNFMRNDRKLYQKYDFRNFFEEILSKF